MNRSAPLFVCACVLLGSPALGQQASTGTTTGDAVVRQSRQLFRDGVEQYKKGDLNGAYSSFFSAFRVRPHYTVASNLAQVELDLGKYRDAAEHAAYALREAPKKDSAHREDEARLRDAKTHVGTLSIKVDAAGADIVVDGVVVGHSPLNDEIFVDPGAKKLQARTADRVSKPVVVQIGAGATEQVELALNDAAPGPALASSSPVPASTIPSAPVAPRIPESSIELDSRPAKGRTAVVLTEAGVALAGVAIGIAFHSKAATEDSRAGDLRSQALSLGPGGCTAYPGEAPCPALRDAVRARDTANTISTIGFVGAGVGGVAALVTYLLWPSPRRPTVAVEVVPGPGTYGGFVSWKGNL